MHKLIRITTVPQTLAVLLKKQLQFMSAYYNIVAVSSNKVKLEIFKESSGISVHPIEMTRKITPLKDILALRNLVIFLRKEKPLIVHTHTPKAGILGMIAAYLAGVPIRMHTVGGLPLLEERGIKRKVLDLVEKLTYHFATNVYPNSYNLKDIILENKYCDKSKLKVIGNGSSNGIDTSYFNPNLFTEDFKTKFRTSLGLKPENFVFCFVGRMVKDKGINELVSAFKSLNQANTKLILVGPYERDLDPVDKETETEIENNPSIIWVGFKPDVRPYLAISNVFVFPSYREGFPNVVMQAGAMNLPCIVSNINGCNEIIEMGKNGIIIPVKNSIKLKEAMEELLFNSVLLARMIEASRLVIVSRYEQQFILNELLKEYNQLQNHVKTIYDIPKSLPININ